MAWASAQSPSLDARHRSACLSPQSPPAHFQRGRRGPIRDNHRATRRGQGRPVGDAQCFHRAKPGTGHAGVVTQKAKTLDREISQISTAGTAQGLDTVGSIQCQMACILVEEGTSGVQLTTQPAPKETLVRCYCRRCVGCRQYRGTCTTRGLLCKYIQMTSLPPRARPVPSPGIMGPSPFAVGINVPRKPGCTRPKRLTRVPNLVPLRYKWHAGCTVQHSVFRCTHK